MFGQNVPGALGLALRKALFPSLLGACGRNVVFGQNVVLRHPHKIRIGDNVAIDDNCLIDAKGSSNQGITIGSGVFVGRNGTDKFAVTHYLHPCKFFCLARIERD